MQRNTLIRSAVCLVGKLLAAATLVLVAACDPRLDVNATANVPAAYSRVLVTVKEIWINESATATPDEDTWQKFNLDDSVTIDLVNLTGGQLAELARNLDVAAGTYNQIRVLLASADEDDDLLDSARDAGATWNNEVSWVDEDGVARISPLQVLNADQGVGIQTQFRVRDEEVDSAVVHIVFDAARDLTEFRYSDEVGFLLNPTLTAFDAEDVGTIRGTLDVSLLGGSIGRPEIQVTAQRLDTASGRREIIASAPVNRSGAFVLYPLPLDEGNEDDTEFDLVIHGPAIEPLVLRGVPVSEGAPAEATSIKAGITLQPATSFEVELDEDTPVAPRGASIAFYQTPPDEDVPYLIELAPVDPVRGLFSRPLRLSRASNISYGDYDDNDLRSNAPKEGAERYAVAAFSPHFGEGPRSGTLLRPATGSQVATFSVPAPGLPAGAVAGTVSATVTVERPGRYDRGVLLVTREGAVVNAVRLEDLLQQSVGSAFVELTPVPAGSAATSFDRALYYLEAWTWDSDDPEDSFERHPGSAVDLRGVDTAAGTVTIR